MWKLCSILHIYFTPECSTGILIVFARGKWFGNNVLSFSTLKTLSLASWLHTFIRKKSVALVSRTLAKFLWVILIKKKLLVLTLINFSQKHSRQWNVYYIFTLHINSTRAVVNKITAFPIEVGNRHKFARRVSVWLNCITHQSIARWHVTYVNSLQIM